MTGMGLSELLILILVGVPYMLLIVAGVWVLVTLQRLRAGQHAIQQKLDVIVRLLQETP